MKFKVIGKNFYNFLIKINLLIFNRNSFHKIVAGIMNSISITTLNYLY